MKAKRTATVVAMLLMAGAAHAADAPQWLSVAEFKYRIIKDDKQGPAGVLAMALGSEGKVSVGSTVAYVGQATKSEEATPQDCWAFWPFARCKAASTASVAVVPLQLGLKLSVTPAAELGRDGSLEAHVESSFADLVSMQTTQAQGLAIEMPRTVQGSSQAKLRFVPGQKIVEQLVPVSGTGAGRVSYELEFIGVR